ncbi:hypothetical protein D8911_03460 [Levilactobacillus brevis]|nr:hypothetical protein D8911_03460 [Levilactobacillus brevis]
MKELLKYILDLCKGFAIMIVLLTWNLQNFQGHWRIPITKFTVWVLLSWLLLYPGLRKAYHFLYSKNGSGIESYKTRSMKMHHQDIANSHKDRRWTTNGVVANPWEYNQAYTQSTDEILNPIFVFCEHLWITFLLIIFGPLIFVFRMVVKLYRNLASKH